MGVVFCAVVGDVVEGGDSVDFPVYVNEHFRVSFFVKRVWNTRKNAIFERKKMYLFFYFFLLIFCIHRCVYVCIQVCIALPCNAVCDNKLGVSMCVSMCVFIGVSRRYVHL